MTDNLILARRLAALAGVTFAAAFGVAPLTQLGAASADQFATTAQDKKMKHHTYVGMWVTADGIIRQELLSNGRYDEARGTRKSSYQGRYEIRGNRIDYWDDTGFTADGTFVGQDELHHGGMIFYRER
jgi:hypothetical protein